MNGVKMDNNKNRNSEEVKIHDLTGMGLLKSIIYFAIPAFILVLSYHGFRLWLLSNQFSDLESFLISLGLPMMLIFFTALIFYRFIERRPCNRREFSNRMRYPKINWKDFIGGIALFTAGFLGYGLMSLFTSHIISNGMIPLPEKIAIMDIPNVALNVDLLNNAAGGQIQGKWHIVIIYTLVLFFNVAGEELWWRGIILPRQEVSLKKNAWIVNGTFWGFFHIFKYWEILNLLPFCLLNAFVAQKRRNNWSSLIAHFFMNISGYIFVLAAAAGWIK
jgi:membrane protease YdiL (CAAX protease family)